ncbi:RagB/SusD family nutrient uptake outer membrane protein [Parabacteroides sp. PF5-6]|uniref:RagB/SusD family nutrient uptake outer membrane protein n=1 Tax=Parabacteroides sp. PF5-6 TaxID=1742403 RepID=UPI002404ABA7|nr:RagB/SusD family nutrient uptake outer membrane protein [Parabacteroides sp. PF5-6]MDF9831006.1 hypothetical protein [Parabacteroides sp. PF5-6]
MKKIFSSILACTLLLLGTGCSEDYLEKNPTTSVSDDDMFSTVVGAETALNGMIRSTYMYYGNHGRFGQKAVDIVMDFMADDLLQTERGYGWFVSWYQYLVSTNATNSDLEYIWAYYYDVIDNANLIILNVENAGDFALNESKGLSIKGQAHAFRAFSYYQLVQMYAKRYEPGGANTHLGLPLVLDDSGERLPRSTVKEVYDQIVKDIDAAIAALSQSTTTWGNKSYITLPVAQGIKARIALTMGDWSTAADMANKARQNYKLTNNYKGGWTDSTDQEWMWGALLISEQQTSYASFCSHIDPLFGGYATLGSHKLGSTEMVEHMADTDLRKQLFQPEKFFSEAVMKSYFAGGKHKYVGYKFSGYGDWDTDYLYMKAGEMYLIEAEALARLGRDAEAQEVIFALTSNRDPEAVKPTVTGDALLQHILLERRCDLWGEGFRWLDIKRMGIPMDRTNKGHNETFWNGVGRLEPNDWRMTFLIPKQELDANPNMVQNDTK